MSEYIDQNMSDLLDTSGCLGGIPACCVPADAVIYVDRFNLFDEYLYSYPTFMFKSKKYSDYIPIGAAIIFGAIIGVAVYNFSKK